MNFTSPPSTHTCREKQASDVSALVNTGPSANTQTKTDLEFNRKKLVCTDICCLVTFLVYMLGMVIIAGIALSTGSPDRLIYGTDYMGNTCAHGPNEKTTLDTLKAIADGGDGMPKDAGTFWDEENWDKFFKNRKAITYPRTNVDQLISKLTAFNPENDVPTLPSFYGLCVNSCPIARPTAATTLNYDVKSRTVQYKDVVCSLSASAEIQRQCKDTKFQEAMAASFNKTVLAKQDLKGWDNTFFNDPEVASYDKELICLTQFFDHCGQDSDTKEVCRRNGASNESLAVVDQDCWKQYINSVEIVNRCVATRSVAMKVVCTNPLKKTFGERKPCTLGSCPRNSEGNSGVSGTCYVKDENGTDVNMCPRPGTTFKGAAQICAQCDFMQEKHSVQKSRAIQLATLTRDHSSAILQAPKLQSFPSVPFQRKVLPMIYV